MTYYLIKVGLSALLVVTVSEIGKRSPSWGGIIASLPLVSVLAIGWLYYETRDPAKVAALTRSTLWYVLPSLAFFLVLPICLKAGIRFGVSLLIGLIVTGGCYVAMAFILDKAGVKLR